MTDERDLRKAWEDIQAYGTGTVMVIRVEEMPAMVEAANDGDPEAGLRLAAASVVVPLIVDGGHNCLFCDRSTTPSDLAAMVFVSKEIRSGEPALFTLICQKCDEPNPQRFLARLLPILGAKRLDHDAGHA